MDKRSPETESLRQNVERKMNRRMKTPNDFDALSLAVWEQLHENISPTTLKRLWGYINGADTTRRSTLCLLARFVGFEDWESYIQHLKDEVGAESNTFRAMGVRTEDLVKGDQVEVSWQPNRRCIFYYEGNMEYHVLSSENSKLKEGDRFRSAGFLIGQPMYLTQLQREGCEMTSYVAGSKSGIVNARIL